MLLFAAIGVFGGTFPSGFSESAVVTGLSAPTAMAFAPDGRIFVCLQGGSLRVIKNGALLGTPFLTVSVNSSGERGLLGVAFDPNFATNNYVYVYYTTSASPIHNRVSRFTASGDVAVAGSEVVIAELENLSSATNHNGGAIHFGPDGKLYVAVGDNANGANSQSFSNRLGKMLRINADGSIPFDNPFMGQTSGPNQAIWAMGLRNPFTFNFHPGNGRMHINDVGQNSWEEVNLGVAGANYGWPNYEGFDGGNSAYADPLVAYHHTNGSPTGCAITGGAFYTGSKHPSQFADAFFYADYCGQWIYYLPAPSYTAQTAFATGLGRSAVDLQVYDGELYYLTRDGGGGVWRIRYTPNDPPAITQHPSDQTVAVGQTATFTVSATGTPPLNYEWQRNGTPIPGAPNLPSYTTGPVSSLDNGALYRCRVWNAYGEALSNQATLTVEANSPPQATIVTPVEGTLYTFGQTINYSGTGTDTQDGTLPASAFTWRVDFHHASHVHPFIGPVAGVTSGSFAADFAETDANVFYRIYLTVRDSHGAETTTYRDVTPRTATVTLKTSPNGLQLKLDAIPVTAPYTFTGVVGQPRTIEAPSPQTVGNRTYAFQSWSDGGARVHTIATPASATTYTARFKRQ
jgi:glucose/arabinose dehydrogenase